METAQSEVINPTRSKQFSRMELFKVMQWIEGHKALTSSITGEELAKKLTQELGFPVSYNQAVVTRSEMGLGPRKEAPRPKMKHEDYKTAIRILAREVMDLRKKLSEPVSHELELLSTI